MLIHRDLRVGRIASRRKRRSQGRSANCNDYKDNCYLIQ
ncbi:hypothetical protein GJA_3953 [Janthinobacterium agaricidamnosum NBRC 102515 = DSM 9628]|uniref:Uncharacterized protein n=1 Tax=Janthinobacterium agaricidamnosum NBRC 102515 = DSM 9628 TaxID=1349767 RepID=W0V6W1_9BURK|nr:hypothetical protein GJA_3953 [Janthinobacterium agaricidamnosum NBRC 102515 = DSM 9628]